MALVNSGLSSVILAAQPGKDSRWLTLEVCREFARSKCSRTDEECKYAHPPAHVEIQNGRVTCCFDSIKGKCHRKDPPCKYLHPPQHLKEILLQNGRQNLILKNLQMQSALQPMLPITGMYPIVYDPSGSSKPVVQAPYSNVIMPGGHFLTMLPQGANSTHPYLISNPAASYSYLNPTMGGYPTILQSYDASNSSVTMAANQQLPPALPSAPITNGSVQSAIDQQNCTKEFLSAASSNPSMRSQPMTSWEETTSSPTQYVALDSSVSPYCQPIYYKGMNGVPNLMPVMKRPALVDAKSGLPMYRQVPSAAAYQPAALAPMHLQQFVPVTIAGQTAVIPRY